MTPLVDNLVSAPRTRRSACLALLGLLLGGAGASRFWRQRAAPPKHPKPECVRSPVLELVPATTAASGKPRPALSAWLMLSSLPRNVQGELLDLIEVGLDSIETRAQPLGIDLTSDELRGRLRELQPKMLPAYNAAVHLASWPWALGARANAVVPRWKPPTVGAAIAALGRTGEAEDDRTRTMRHAAWALANGLLIKTGGAADAERLRAPLTEAVTKVSSAPALVVDQRVQRFDQRLVPWKRWVELRRRAARVAPRIDWHELSARHPLEARLLEGLRVELPRPPALSWFELGEGELFVAPKLGSLARGGELWREVQDSARHAGVRVSVVTG